MPRRNKNGGTKTQEPKRWNKISTPGELAVLPQLALLVLLACALEFWFEAVAIQWALLVAVVAIMLLHGRQQVALELQKQGRQLASHLQQQMLANQPITAKESTAWLNKLVSKLWPNVLEPRVMLHLQLLAERNMRSHKPKSIRGVDVQNYSLGNSAPEVGLGRTYWSTDPSGQEVLHTGLRWISRDLAVQLAVHLGGSQQGQMAHVVISSVQIEGDVRILPILDGQGLLYSFEKLPEVDMSVALAPGSQNLPFDLPGTKCWLEQVMMESLHLATVEPGHHLWTLVPRNLYKMCIGGVVTVSVESGSNLSRSFPRNGPDATNLEPESDQSGVASSDPAREVQWLTFVDISFEDESRQTKLANRRGPNPKWADPLNLVMHDNEGLLQLNVYEQREDGVTCDFLGSCDVKIKYGEDDSVFCWGVGSQGRVVAGRAEKPGSAVNLTIPLQHASRGSISIALTVHEWFFAHDGSAPAPAVTSVEALRERTLQPWPPLRMLTGRTLVVTPVEGRGLVEEGTTARPNLYLRLHYGKNMRKTMARSDANPVWDEEFRFLEVSGAEQLLVSCWDARSWGHTSLGTARINLQGIAEGIPKELKLPLEKAGVGEVHLKVAILREDKSKEPTEAPHVNSRALVPLPAPPVPKGHATAAEPFEKLQLAVLEARNLRLADRSEHLDPYVSITYGTQKRKTKVVHRSAHPAWQQEFEFPAAPGPVVLHLKDHHSLTPSQSIGHVELSPASFPLNQTEDRWIPLKEVGGGEIHLRITRTGPGGAPAVTPEKPVVVPTEAAAKTTIGKLQKTSQKMRLLLQTAYALAEEGEESAEVAGLVDDIQRHEDEREALVAQLQKDREVLLAKIKQLEVAMAAF